MRNKVTGLITLLQGLTVLYVLAAGIKDVMSALFMGFFLYNFYSFFTDFQHVKALFVKEDKNETNV